jgi:septum site-determining protein MinD
MKTKVIAIHSFKGGTGKTTLTANLASTLALDHRVGVMDLDLSGPGLHVLFGLRKGDIKATLTDIFLGDASPADVVVDLSRKYGLTKGGLFFCPASNKVEDMLRLLKSGLEVSVFQDILQKVGESKNLDYIIVDTHPGVENDTVLAMGCCDALVLVSRVDQQDLFGTAVMVLLAETFEKPTYLALNMVPPGVKVKDAVKVGQELADLFKSKFLEAFEFQIDVINNLSRSVFVLDHPNSTFARKVGDAADFLVKELGEAPKIAN